MKKRIGLVAMLAICLYAASLLTGCGTFGNGKIDPGGVVLLDLSQIEIGVGFVGPTGQPFTVTKTPDGIDVQGELVDHNGNLWAFGEGQMAITATNPETGLQVSIAPKTGPPEPEP